MAPPDAAGIRYKVCSLRQVSSLISALVILFILLFFAPLFYDLQKCVLACIIIVSLRGALRKFKDVPSKWRSSRNDAIVWLVTMAATALISVELGLLVGVTFSMICVIFKIQNPKVSGLLPKRNLAIHNNDHVR